MNVTVSKWGNSLGIRIPKGITEELDLREGSSLTLIPAQDGYFLRRAQPQVSYLLGDLVDQMRSDSRPETLDWGPDRGDEIIEDGGW